MNWKSVKPSWCPHLRHCLFLIRVQDFICAGKLPKPRPHDGDFNTHRLCLMGALPNDEVFDLMINKSDVYHFKRVLDVITKDLQ